MDANAGYFHPNMEAGAFSAHIHEGHGTGVDRLMLRAACRCLQLSHVSCLPSRHLPLLLPSWFMCLSLEEDQ